MVGEARQPVESGCPGMARKGPTPGPAERDLQSVLGGGRLHPHVVDALAPWLCPLVARVVHQAPGTLGVLFVKRILRDSTGGARPTPRATQVSTRPSGASLAVRSRRHRPGGPGCSASCANTLKSPTHVATVSGRWVRSTKATSSSTCCIRRWCRRSGSADRPPGSSPVPQNRCVL